MLADEGKMKAAVVGLDHIQEQSRWARISFAGILRYDIVVNKLFVCECLHAVERSHADVYKLLSVDVICHDTKRSLTGMVNIALIWHQYTVTDMLALPEFEIQERVDLLTHYPDNGFWCSWAKCRPEGYQGQAYIGACILRGLMPGGTT